MTDPVSERPTVCPYCGRPVEFRPTSDSVYRGRDYGPIYVCAAYPKCDAYVGCHKGTERALGRLADKELRRAKVAAHEVFDGLWRAKMNRAKHLRQHEARGRAYKWLAEQMQMHVDDCHIGMMTLEQCRRVREICQPYAQRIGAVR